MFWSFWGKKLIILLAYHLDIQIYMFYNLNPKINANFYPKQKMFTLEEIYYYDNLFGSLTISLWKHILQTIYIRLFVKTLCIFRNIQALGHNPVPHLSPREKGWQTVPIATIINKKIIHYSMSRDIFSKTYINWYWSIALLFVLPD